jgi:hypothetical protein
MINPMPTQKNTKESERTSLNVSGKLHRIYREKNGDVVVNHHGSKKQNGSYDKINLSNVAGVKSVKGGVKATKDWHKDNPHTDVKKFDSPAWTRSEGKNPEGGLNAKGRASAKAQGHNLKPPVKSGDNPRRASFLARMGNMPGPERKPNGEPTRLLLSLQKWGASSKEDARSKAASISVNKGLPSALRAEAAHVKANPDLMRKMKDKNRLKLHLAGKEISRFGEIKTDSFKAYAVPYRHLPDGGLARKNGSLKQQKYDLSRSRASGRTINAEAARRKGAFETSASGQKAEMYRQERLGRVNKGIRRIPGQMEIPGIGDVVQQTAKRRLPTEGRWKHLSGKTSRVRIVGPSSTSKDSFEVVDNKDVRRTLPRNSIIFTKPKNVSKSMEYSVVMNQSRFGGASAVGKAYDDKPKPVWEKPNPSGDSDPLSKKKKASAKARARAAGRPYPNLIDNMAAARSVNKADLKTRIQASQAQRDAKLSNRKTANSNIVGTGIAGGLAGAGLGAVSKKPKMLVPLGAVLGTATGGSMAAIENSQSRKRHVNLVNNMRRKGVDPTPLTDMAKAEQTYDAYGNPVATRKPLMSGDAKLGAAGTAIGLVGAQRVASAGTLPSRLQGQSDAMASRVKFQERLADDQIKRVQAASQIPNRFTRNKQVRMSQYYSDKAQGSLANARAKQTIADNALKAAPAKKLAHLKSGGALLATGGAMSGLAVYNNAKDRKNKAKAK